MRRKRAGWNILISVLLAAMAVRPGPLSAGLAPLPPGIDTLYNAGQYRQAAEALQEAVERNPKLNELITAVEQGYKEYLDGISAHNELALTVSFAQTTASVAKQGSAPTDIARADTGPTMVNNESQEGGISSRTKTPEAVDDAGTQTLIETAAIVRKTDDRAVPLSQNDSFLKAINDEIDRQVHLVRSGVQIIRPIVIPVPQKLTIFASKQPQRLFDVELKPTFTRGTNMDGEVIDFGMLHPLTGIVFFGEQCATVDFRRHDDPADVQPYWTTCNNSTACVHTPYSRSDLFGAENKSLVAVPLYAPYFLQIRVQASRQENESIPRVSGITATLRYLQ